MPPAALSPATHPRRTVTARAAPSARHRAIAAAGRLAAAAERWLAHDRVWAAAVAAVMVLQLALTLSHTPWLDEYQALQIAVQTPDLRALLANLRYEGHPPLWYLLLRGAAAVVPAWWVLAAVATPLALTTQGIVLLRAPSARLDRLFVATSAFVLFEYDAVSRSLTLGVTLFLIAFAWRGRRWSWIALALLPMADFLFGVLSLVLVAIAVRERRLYAPGVAAWIAIGALAAWSVVPAPDVVPAFARGAPLSMLGEWLNNLSTLLVPLQFDGARPTWNMPPPPFVSALAGPLFLVFALRQTRGQPLHRVLLLGFIALTALFSIAVYPLAIRHLSLAALLLIVLAWRAREGGAASDGWFRAWLAMLSLGGLISAAAALAMPFDTAPAAAATIRRLGLRDAPWLAFPDSRAQGVAALNGMAFGRVEQGCAQQFVRWNHRSHIVRVAQLTRAIAPLTARYGRLHLLSDMPIAGGPPGFYTPLAVISAGYDGQAFYLYAVRGDLPAGPARMPACVPGLRPLGIGR
jgi:hypothetical protein